ncbi:serine protease [Candidatus Latescibacterota bacterium]
MYDTAYPGGHASRQLRSIAETVCKVYYSVSYEVCFLPPSPAVTSVELTQALLTQAIPGGDFTHSVSGTATVIFAAPDRIALLSCAHIFASPDTITTFFRDSTGVSTDRISSVSVAGKREIFISDLPGGTPWRVLLGDRDRDIAIVARELSAPLRESVPVLTCPLGRARQLGWGAFTYVVGHPRGTGTITTGIVSQPDRDGEGGFLVDALFNTGSSGSIVLALRNGLPNLELVGMAVSASGSTESYLMPKEGGGDHQDASLPYEGDVYVEDHTALHYGITHVVPAESIRALLFENRGDLLAEGYDFGTFIGLASSGG